MGSLGSFRRERQLAGFALVPLAASLLVVLPLRLALFGGDTFHDGGADEGTGEAVLLGLQLVFAAWSLGLLLLGVRVVHGWDWLRSAAVVVSGAALLAAWSASRARRGRQVRPLQRLVASVRGGLSALQPGLGLRDLAAALLEDLELLLRHRVRVLLLGEAPLRTSSANAASAVRMTSADVGVALDEPRGVALVEAEQVVPDEHLAVAVRCPRRSRSSGSRALR